MRLTVSARSDPSCTSQGENGRFKIVQLGLTLGAEGVQGLKIWGQGLQMQAKGVREELLEEAP